MEREYNGEYYETAEEAFAVMKAWQETAYKNIEERGDKVLRDDSHVYQKLVWSKPIKMEGCELYSSHETDVYKWFVWHAIITQNMIDDLQNMKPIDHEAELEALLKNQPTWNPKDFFKR